MGKLKEYLINNLTEEEINKKAEDEFLRQELFWELRNLEIKDSLTSQSVEGQDTHQTYPF
jgi:hypothetical protein